MKFFIDLQDPSDVRLSLRAATSAPCVMARCGCDATFDGDKTLYMRPGGTLDIFTYNTTSDAWSQLPRCSTKFCSIAMVNKMLTTIGGEINLESTNKLFSLVEGGNSSMSSYRWVETLPPMPSKQTRTRAVSYGTHLIIAGKDSRTVELLNANSRQWFTVGNLPTSSDLRTLVLSGEHLYSVHDNDSMFRCSVYDLIRAKEIIWNEIHCTGILYGSTYIALNNQLLSIGGRCVQGEPTTAVRIYSPDTNTWEVIGHTEIPRMFCFASVFHNDSFIVAGGFTSYTVSSNNKTNKVEIGSFC